MIADLDALLARAVTEVFQKMLDLPMSLDRGRPTGQYQVAGAVGFIGDSSGVIYVYLGNPFARRITCQLLQITDSEIESEAMVNDVVGEMANMVAGQVKSELNDRGGNYVLTIPAIVRGSHFTIEPMSSAERRVVVFRSGEDQLLLEVLLKSHTAALAA
ncbi:MAG TPA: chemotaxis protein CheX [Verrucomicrobiae bacterium]|nr:chemotaxis protein CheX [Verrucomicrobiae bacterium]